MVSNNNLQCLSHWPEFRSYRTTTTNTPDTWAGDWSSSHTCFHSEPSFRVIALAILMQNRKQLACSAFLYMPQCMTGSWFLNCTWQYTCVEVGLHLLWQATHCLFFLQLVTWSVFCKYPLVRMNPMLLNLKGFWFVCLWGCVSLTISWWLFHVSKCVRQDPDILLV